MIYKLGGAGIVSGGRIMAKKRFEYKNHKVFDNLTGEEHSSNMVSVNVLNALHEEKERWRESWIEEMQDQEVQSNTILELMKENEQLKNKLNLILEKKYHEFIDGDIGNFKIEDLELKE